MMTLVLPAILCGGDSRKATTSSSLFTPTPPATAAGRNSAMPCGFDSEPVDFESALLSATFVAEWPTLKDLEDEPTQTDNISKSTPDLSPNVHRGDTSSESSPPTSSSSKRKLSTPCISLLSDPAEEETEEITKRPKVDVENGPSASSTSSTSSSSSSSLGENMDISDYTSATPSTSKCESEGSRDSTKESDPSEDPSIDDLLYIPRRRVAQLWSPRLRWKDERRKVLKMSLNKLRRIEDHELYLLRSVLINNTVKRLQREIREEKSAKYHPPAHEALAASVARGAASSSASGEKNKSRDDSRSPSWASWTPLSFSSDGPTPSSSSSSPSAVKSDVPSSVLEDENSCDEIFGINEDFLRITIPQRRSVSPALPLSLSPVDELRSEEKGSQLTGGFSSASAATVGSGSGNSNGIHHFPAVRLNADSAPCGTCHCGCGATLHDTSRKASDSRATPSEASVYRACPIRTKKEWAY